MSGYSFCLFSAYTHLGVYTHAFHSTHDFLQGSHGGLNLLGSRCRWHRRPAPSLCHVHLWLCPCNFAGLGPGGARWI